MTMGFFVFSCTLAIGLAVGIISMRKFHHEFTKSMQILFCVAIITILWNAIGVIAPAENFATFAHGVYLACTDWLIIVLLYYAKIYTRDTHNTVIVRYVIYILAGIDTISMIVNTFTHHVFSCRQVEFKGSLCYEMVPNMKFYRLHLFFVYGIALMVILAFVVKTVQTHRVYRRKYEVILASFFVILAANVGYRFVNWPIDFSSIFYSLLALATGYFSIFYAPRGLVRNLLGLSVKNLYNGVVCYDREGQCLYYNEMAVKLLNMRDDYANPEEGFEQMLKYWLRGRNAGEVEDYSMQYEQETEEGTRYIKASFAKLIDDKGSYLGCSFLADDKTKDIMSLKEEHYKATHDGLTKALNRDGFFEEVRKALLQYPDLEWYMACSDIKDFKLVNELFGVETGDRILKKTADIIRKNASEHTIFGRLSADRFAILLLKERCNEELFKKCLLEIEDMAKNDVYRMHVHMGVYKILNPDMEIAVMCDRALLAISQIKNDYEQMVAYYDENLSDSLHECNKMINEFDKAIEEGQFQIFLQPQIAVDRSLLGAEALVRWFHPEDGLVAPAHFIPIFEKSGQIYKLDCYIWEQACKQLRQWMEQGKENIHISVNISPKDFYYVDIYETFTGLVKKYEINPRNLKLEITETALMTDLQQQLGLLQRLRDYGFTIEVDDFGSGYSSLNTLKDMEVDVLKIDMGFLDETENKERSRTILNSVISMSKELGLVIVTEGVETERQVDYLTGAGCDIFQGYYFDKPMPVTEFENKYFVTENKGK